MNPCPFQHCRMLSETRSRITYHGTCVSQEGPKMPLQMQLQDHFTILPVNTRVSHTEHKPGLDFKHQRDVSPKENISCQFQLR